MTSNLNSLAEARRAAASPLFADLAGDIGVSFEFFPPKTEKMEEKLWESVQTLEPLAPRFVSVTYGAGGSTRERTHATVARIAARNDAAAAAHLTCVEATARGDRRGRARPIGTRACATSSRCAAIRPWRRAQFVPHPDGYANAAELVAGLKASRRSRFRSPPIPNAIPIRRTAAADLDNLKRKIDAGADRAITQFFFSPDCFFRFRDAAAAAGIDAEIVPGILPVSNVAADAPFAGDVRHRDPGLDGPAVRGARRSSRRAPAGRGDGRRRDVPAALCGRRAPFPFLHAQPGRAELRDLPSARPATGYAAKDQAA